MKKCLAVIVLCLALALVGCDKFKGPQGDQGPQGNIGTQGPQGPQGQKGSGIDIIRYDGQVNGNDYIYASYSKLTADTPVEVYVGLASENMWMPIACSGLCYYYLDLDNKYIAIKYAAYCGWTDYRIFVYVKN